MSTVCVGGRGVVNGEVKLEDDDAYVVTGDGVISVRGSDDVAFVRTVAGFEPPAGLRDRIVQTNGWLDLVVETQGGLLTKVRVGCLGLSLNAGDVRVLREALQSLALSFDRRALAAEARVRVAETGDHPAVEVQEELDEERHMHELHQALERNLPGLLRKPLHGRRLARMPIRAERARQSPSVILQRLRDPARRTLLDRSPAPSPPLGDYAWLRRVVERVRSWGHAAVMQRTDISDASSTQQPWLARLAQLKQWLEHDAFADLGAVRASTPSWVLSRSSPGAAIMRAEAASPISERILGASERGGMTNRDVTLPVARDAHLYELWVFQSVVDVLQATFGFELAEGEPRSWSDYYKIGNEREFAVVRPFKLVVRREGLNSQPLELAAEIAFDKEHPQRTTGDALTPDVTLTIVGGPDRRRTVHVLDAKMRDEPAKRAREYARDTYLLGPTERPTSSFIAMPIDRPFPRASATTARWMAVLDEQFRANPSSGGWEELQVRSPDDTPLPYGFAWGSVAAWPVDTGSGDAPEAPPSRWFGIRLFVTMALQYHRSELRHICAQCGVAACMEDILLEGRRQTVDALARRRRILAAHGDEADPKGGATRGRIIYQCPSGHKWSRDACKYGHVLMKYGRLTPHKQATSALDHNVVCGVCGHWVGGTQWGTEGGGPRRRPRSEGGRAAVGRRPL